MADRLAPVDAVSFDLDDTLCRYERPSAEVLADAFDAVGTEALFDVEAYVATFDRLATAVDDMPTLRRRAFEELAAAADADPAAGRAIAEAYTEARDPSAVTWRRGMAAAFEAIAARYPVVIVTNGLPDAQAAKLDRLGIADAVETVVHGDEVRKPAPAPFHTALEAVGVSPGRAVHVGDSLEHDVAGAKRVGMHAVWYPRDPPRTPPDGGPRPDRTISDGDDLIATLGR